jgi:tropomyosin
VSLPPNANGILSDLVFANLFRNLNNRLRLTDVKAEHYERKVATVESERDMWEKKYEECHEKFKAGQDELNKITQALNDL